jgi:hypothetical protein
MSEEKYKAAITAVPAMNGAEVVWGWRAELLDLSTEEKQTFEFNNMFSSSKEALENATKSLRALIRAYDEVAIYQVDLYAPEPEPEETPEAEETPAEEPAAEETPAADNSTAETGGTEEAK